MEQKTKFRSKVSGSFTEFRDSDWDRFDQAMSESLTWLAANHSMTKEQWDEKQAELRRQIHSPIKQAADHLGRETEPHVQDRSSWIAGAPLLDKEE